MFRISYLLAVGFALEAKAACDFWNQTSGAIRSVVMGNFLFNPLNGSTFESNNTAEALVDIYFQASGTGAPFFDLGCPDPLTASVDNSTGNLHCTGNITASDLTESVQMLETKLGNLAPGVTAYGYGNYTAQGEGCASESLNMDGFIFYTDRSTEKRHGKEAEIA